MPSRQLCVRIVSSPHADELLIIEHKGYKCKLRRSIFIKHLKKKTQKASSSKISSCCKCSSTFPFTFLQTKVCLCSGLSLQGLPTPKPSISSPISHTFPTEDGDVRRHQHCHLPLPFSEPCVYTHCCHGMSRDLWQAAWSQGAPTSSPLTHTHLTRVCSAAGSWTVNDTNSYDKTKRESSFGLINHQNSSCLWGQCAHKSEPAAVAMAGKEGGVSHREQPLRGARVNGVTAQLEEPLQHLPLSMNCPKSRSPAGLKLKFLMPLIASKQN